MLTYRASSAHDLRIDNQSLAVSSHCTRRSVLARQEAKANVDITTNTPNFSKSKGKPFDDCDRRLRDYTYFKFFLAAFSVEERGFFSPHLVELVQDSYICALNMLCILGRGVPRTSGAFGGGGGIEA